MDLKDFLQLAGKQGKVVVLGDDGNVKGVFLPFDEFQKLGGGKSEQQQVKVQEDIVEKVNREILQAQLEDVISSNDGGNSASQLLSDPVETEEPVDLNPPERIDALINKRAQDLFKSIPNYNFIPPEVATSVDEEIKPNFDDI